MSFYQGTSWWHDVTGSFLKGQTILRSQQCEFGSMRTPSWGSVLLMDRGHVSFRVLVTFQHNGVWCWDWLPHNLIEPEPPQPLWAGLRWNWFPHNTTLVVFHPTFLLWQSVCKPFVTSYGSICCCHNCCSEIYTPKERKEEHSIPVCLIVWTKKISR